MKQLRANTVLRGRLLSLVATSLLTIAASCSCDQRTTAVARPNNDSDISTTDVAHEESRFQLLQAPMISASTSSNSVPLVMRGRGSTARIIDNKDDIVLSGDRKPIYGLQLSPGHGRALVYYGDAEYEVFDAYSLESLAIPPSQPEGFEDATGFGWVFLDPHHLLGLASLPSTDTAGKTMAEIEGLPPRATLLYIYNLESGILTPVMIDDALPFTFSIHNVAGWNVTLLTHDSELVGARIVISPDRDIDAP